MEKLKVKAIRINLGYDQETFSNMLDMPLGTYRMKEQGKSPWLYREILKICKLTGVDIRNISEE